jgi:hypothetical protein
MDTAESFLEEEEEEEDTTDATPEGV